MASWHAVRGGRQYPAGQQAAFFPPGAAQQQQQRFGPVSHASAPMMTFEEVAPAPKAEAPTRVGVMTIDKLSDASASASAANKGVLGIIEDDKRLTAAAKILGQPELQQEVEAHAKNGGVDVFAPTNDAFMRLSQTAKARLQGNSSEAKAKRAHLMAQHIAPKVSASEQAFGAQDELYGAAPFPGASGYFDSGSAGSGSDGVPMRSTLVGRASLSVQESNDGSSVVLHDPETGDALAKAPIRKMTMSSETHPVTGEAKYTVHAIDDFLLPQSK